jgi:hypothetical protein
MLLVRSKLAHLADTTKPLLLITVMSSHGNVALLVQLLLGNDVTTIAEVSILVTRLLLEVLHLGQEIVDVAAKAEAIPTKMVNMATTLLPQHRPLLLGNKQLQLTLQALHLVDILAIMPQATTLLILREEWAHHLALLLLLD